MSSKKLFPLALVSALLLSTAVLAQGGGGGGGGGGGAGAGGAGAGSAGGGGGAGSAAGSSGTQILQARPGAAAPILQQAIRTPEVWTPTPMV